MTLSYLAQRRTSVNSHMSFQGLFTRKWFGACAMNIYKVSAWSLLLILDALSLNLCSARHPLLPLICLESERSYLLILLLCYSIWFIWSICFCHGMQNWSHLSLQRPSAFIVIVTSRKHERRLGSQKRLIQL